MGQHVEFKCVDINDPEIATWQAMMPLKVKIGQSLCQRTTPVVAMLVLVKDVSDFAIERENIIVI